MPLVCAQPGPVRTVPFLGPRGVLSATGRATGLSHRSGPKPKFSGGHKILWARNFGLLILTRNLSYNTSIINYEPRGDQDYDRA